MPRLPLLTLALGGALAVAGGRAFPFSGHEDPSKLDRPCTPCHAGHGVSRTPMLREAGDGFCLGCHSSRGADPQARRARGMSSSARPADIESELGKQYTHRWAACRDCHSVHGVGGDRDAPVQPLTMGQVKRSTRRGFDTEADLCLSCHGTREAGQGDPHDLGVLFDPRNPSYHPVLAIGPAADVPSLQSPLTTDSRLNCTDCHTNDDPSGPRGPHASRTESTLGNTLNRQEGQPESATAYALCYACHDRGTVLERDGFPDHRRHVVNEGAPCTLCHDPHGATAARAMIRFNEPTAIQGVTASSSGLLRFESTGPGSGACYLTCHAVDHDPKAYGPGAMMYEMSRRDLRARPGAIAAPNAHEVESDRD